MKLNLRRILIFLLIVALSVGFGFAFDAIATAVEKSTYPLSESYREDVRANAEEFGIPEHILWGFVKTQSDFSSNKVSSDGSIGLTQLTPDEFFMISKDILGEPTEQAELLYAPSANLRCGAAYLSSLYHRYGVWETAFAAYEVGTETVDAWLLDPTLLGDNGILAKIPDENAARFAKETAKACEYYKRLYFES
ncbi:MAG: lytic transglycosylase domain-containing protein [Ruminococcaceae bacterium]|nr:lytic transglycosylase domain-containing protein [Oscillospiraceae bacterium]